MKDKLYSHSITNYLFASYQGKFTYLNILTQLQHPLARADEMSRTRTNVSKISSWVSQLWQGSILFAPNSTDAGTIDSKLALKLLDDLRPELKTLAVETKRILTSPQTTGRNDDHKFLVAAFGRFAYGRDHYLRGFVEFARNFNLPAMLNEYTPLLTGTEDDVRVANALFETFKASPQLDANFFAVLRFRCLSLPGIFGTYVHDICQLLGPFRGGFSYDTGDFTPEQAKLWLNAGFEPGPAGYWNAYDISPEESFGWLSLNIFDPAIAFEWRLYGFNPELALEWIKFNIPPPIARAWVNVGYDPERAMQQIEKGVDPQSAPKINTGT